MEHLDTILDYHRARSAVKCKLFVNAERCCHDLVQGTTGQIDRFMGELCSEFTSHFTVRRKRLKAMASLNVVVLNKKATMREYVERFSRADIEVPGAQDDFKCFIFERNLRDDCKFKEELGLQAAKHMNDLLTRAQPH